MGVQANPFLKFVLPGIVLFLLAGPAVCQSAQIDVFQAPVVPQTIRYDGVAAEHAREAVEIVFRIYSSMEGGEPLWSETQSVSVGTDGKYSVFLGTDTPGGLPQTVFVAGQARWLGISVAQGAEQTRIPLVSVAYAMKAADAETLGGLPVSAFVRTNPSVNSGSVGASAGGLPSQPDVAEFGRHVSGFGTPGFIPLWAGVTRLGNSILFQSAGQVGVGTQKPGATLDSVGKGVALRGTSSGKTGIGVFGNATSTSGLANGVRGEASSTTAFAAGVSGFESAMTGQVWGVGGSTNSTTSGAAGVSGYEGSATGQVYGVSGNTNSTTNGAAAVNGGEYATTGVVYGVNGGTNSTTNGAAGVNGYEGATTGVVYGVQGNTSSPAGFGVSGIANSTTGNGVGVQGTSAGSGSAAVGVNGVASSSTGNTTGVQGVSLSPDGTGVLGTNTSGAGGNGVIGISITTGAISYGVQGIAGPGGYGVSGTAPNVGVIGLAESQCGPPYHCPLTAGTGGVFGAGTGGLVLNGLTGLTNSNVHQVFYVNASGSGYFAGDLNVTGRLTKGSGSFKIDHPLDPANKYLSHSFVESPDMMNVYNGNIMTDKHGLATVVLPDYFEALNRDFRYQLTVIGQFAQAIVAREINGNRFVIRTSKPGVKVSWQVTGIRQDAYANANRIPVEENKPTEERGLYLHPEVFGQPADKSVTAAEKASNPDKVRAGSR